ncbi:MAG TPA: DUF58 domain-containing protein [Cytophagales bacterium]|nr:DUF58 domain-containing protein [Cytophagales bacterium]HAP60971.1 DUF58 domain-containing protein [Cytophagales bacterium]
MVIAFVVAFYVPVIEGVVRIILFTLIGLTLFDLLLLYTQRHGIFARRTVTDRLSNGDINPVEIVVENHYAFPIHTTTIDEIPHQFQRRDIRFLANLPSRGSKVISYELRPVKRGEFVFGKVHVYVNTVMGLVTRRYTFDQGKDVAVYPSYMQMRKYELLAIHNQLTDSGIKKIRRVGHNREFEQIKEYVVGDDIRTINWKATARRNQLMVNSYQDEKAQQVYAVIDKGRAMQMPFEGMTLLDYAINASLVISNIAILKSDRAGLVTFQHKDGTLIPASRRNAQMQLLMEALYKQKTAFKEADYARLYTRLQYKLTQRSLLLLFTNFESHASLERQLPYLRKLAKRHVLVVIFFENTELRQLLDKQAESLEEIYIKTIAEKFSFEKRLIAKELKRHGIHTVLTAPQNLTVDTINKYLELKARGII